METRAELDLPCGPHELYEHVALLDRYPPWMPLVHATSPATERDDRPAWDVELRTRIGPLARSKRLRMVRTAAEPDRRAVFERQEVDGRRHAAWVLTVAVEPTPTGSHLEMHLSYGGSLWGAVLERVLAEEIRRGSENLFRLVSDAPTR